MEESGKLEGRVRGWVFGGGCWHGGGGGVGGGMCVLNWVWSIWDGRLWLCDLTSPAFHVMAVVIQNPELTCQWMPGVAPHQHSDPLPTRHEV